MPSAAPISLVLTPSLVKSALAGGRALVRWAGGAVAASIDHSMHV
jgi:hypothetical protein